MSTALKIRATQTRTTETRAVGSASRAGRLDAIWAGLPSADRFVLLGHDREVLEAGGSGWRRSLRLSRPSQARRRAGQPVKGLTVVAVVAVVAVMKGDPGSRFRHFEAGA
jgi:hypothetical protein